MKKLLKFSKNTKRLLTGTTALTLMASGALAFAPKSSAAISNIYFSDAGSDSGSAIYTENIGGIIQASGNASGVLESPMVVNFTLGSTLSASETIRFELNGLVVRAAGDNLASTDLTFGGTCSGTPSMTTITAGTSNPTLSITGITCTAGYATLTSNVNEFNVIATAGNYRYSVTTPNETGSSLLYVADFTNDENEVTVEALVPSTLAFTITQTGAYDTALNPNLCDLGSLATNAVATCDYRLNVSTNASAYSVYVAADGDLNYGSNTINAISEDSNNGGTTAVDAGFEEYGISLNAGTASGGAITEGTVAGFNDDDSAIPTTAALLYSSAGPNNPDVNTETALVTHRAAIAADTAAGLYNQVVTYYVNATY